MRIISDSSLIRGNNIPDRLESVRGARDTVFIAVNKIQLKTDQLLLLHRPLNNEICLCNAINIKI